MYKRQEHAAGNIDFDYARMSDEDAEPAREGLVQEKGFFILPSELFCNVRARADQDENLNETLERIFAHIESSAASGDAENDFAGLFDDFDVNSKSIGETVAKRNKVLAELLDGVAQMPLYDTGGINPDLFGDAYEYLMSSQCRHPRLLHLCSLHSFRLLLPQHRRLQALPHRYSGKW